MDITARIPVVAGLAYIEHVRGLPQSCTVTLSAEPDNRYFRHAIAVAVQGTKVGYLAPELAAHYYDAVKNATAPVSCEARRAAASDHDTSGVELLLDFTHLPISQG